MASDGAALAADSSICAVCVIACTEALWTYCLQKPFGLSSGTPCGGTRGCCGKYLQSGFDEDEFEKAERKERERSQRQNSNSRINGGDTSVSAACDSESVGKAHPIAPLKSKGQVADTVKEQPTAVQTMNATLRAE